MPARTFAQWERLAGEVIVAMLEVHAAMTNSEMGHVPATRSGTVPARASTLTHLTAARNKLFKDGVIRQAVATTRGRIVRSSRGISLQWTRSPPLPSQLESAYSPLDTMGGLEGAARDAG